MDNLNEQMQILISAYLDGEVTPEEKRIVEEYLQKNPSAREFVRAQRRIFDAIQSLPDQSLSPDVETNIQSRIQRSKEGRTMKKEQLISVFAVFVVLMTAGVFAFNHLFQTHFQLAAKPKEQTQRKTEIAMVTPAAQTTVKAVMGAQRTEIYDNKSNQGRKVLPSAAAFNRVVDNQDASLEAMSGSDAFVVPSSTAGAYRQGALLARSLPGIDEGWYQAERPILGASQSMIYSRVEEGFNTEEYQQMNENEFKTVADNPLSTFSIDVDTASYANIRRMLSAGQMPPVDAVRIEEMINYFDYDYPQPKDGEPFSITTQAAVCPWNPDHDLVRIGLKGKTLDAQKLPPSNLVFLIDVSGSMNSPDKLPLLKTAFGMMVRQLSANEKVAIVVYAGAAGTVLDSTPGDDKQKILDAISRLNAGGSTAGGQGIELAYRIAKENFIKGGNNRVILATDGDFNVGVSSTGDLTRIIEEKRKEGIFLTVLGFGTGNIKDSRMEQLADKGNGNYYYIDTEREGKKVLIQELGSVLFAIAKDVKIQIEFNPAQVKAYRLVGYETRMLSKEDFNDDTKDAGELGAGHTVTALYEIVPADSAETFGSVDPLKYQKTERASSDDLMTVKLRYKNPDEETSRLIEKVLKTKEIKQDLKGDFEFAAAVAEFGMVLRNSKFKGQSSYDHAVQSAKQSLGEDKFGYRQEFVDLVEKARELDLRGSEGILFKE